MGSRAVGFLHRNVGGGQGGEDTGEEPRANGRSDRRTKGIGAHRKVVRVDFDKTFRQFMGDKKAQGLAEASLEFYEKSWRLFRRFWDGQQEIDRFLLRDYLLHLRLTNNATSTGSWWRGLRVFLRWCHTEELLPSDPTEKVKAPRAEFRQKQPLTEEELARVFAAAKLPRDRALLALMIDTGLRNREVRELRVEDVDLEQRQVRVRRGKGAKSRNVPLSLEAARHVRRWLPHRDRLSPWLFHSLRHDNVGEAFTRNGLYQVISDLGKRAGVKVGPHLLRHSFARSFIAQHGSVAALQSMLGHSSLQVTGRYVALNCADLAEQHEVSSPFAKVSQQGKRSR